MKSRRSYVDEIMRNLQGIAEETSAMRLGTLPLRLGMALKLVVNFNFHPNLID